jgi:hypothetical protein
LIVSRGAGFLGSAAVCRAGMTATTYSDNLTLMPGAATLSRRYSDRLVPPVNNRKNTGALNALV